MATICKCSVPGCGARFEPGYGTRGGDEPLCSLHLARWRRGKRGKELEAPAEKGQRSTRITFHCSAALKRLLRRQAARDRITVSALVEKLLTEMAHPPERGEPREVVSTA